MKGEGDLASRADRLAAFAKSLQELCDAIEAFPAPTIAVLDGTTLGGGLELALACDFRIASTAISLGLPETKLGLIPGAGGTQRVTRAVGRARALNLVLTGRMLAAQEAAGIGLIQEAVEGSAAARALELAAQLAGQPVRALQEAKRCIALAGTAEGYAAEIEATRLALEQALPTLAGSLREAGFTLAGGGVFQQARDGGAPERDPGQDFQGGAAAGAARSFAVPEAARPAGTIRPSRGLVDLYA